MTSGAFEFDGARPKLPSGRHGLSRRFVQSNQRARILNATIEAAAEHGYASTNVEDIVRRAGVSRRTFYELFGNKHDAFLAAYDAAAKGLFAAVEEAMTRESAFEPRIIAGFAAFIGHLAALPGPARVCIVEALAAGPDAAARRTEVMTGFARVIDESARSLPHYSVMPAMTAEAIVGGAYDAVFRHLGSGRELPALLPDLVEVALLPYVGVDVARRHGDLLRSSRA
jgi:AcrR family transcriptional regulator